MRVLEECDAEWRKGGEGSVGYKVKEIGFM